MLTRKLYFAIRFFFNLHVIGRKGNHQPGILKANSKTPNLASLLGLLCLNFEMFNLGVCPPERGMFHVTEASHANMCGVFSCFRGEKMPPPEVGPPEQSQRDLRRPLAQPRPSAVPEKNRGRRKPGFSSRLVSQTTRTPTRP